MNNKTPETESFTTSAVIIVPTYNNGTTIKEVIEAVKKYCKDIIVINDGSTDNTSEILNSINTIKVISFPENRGKGAALKEGFKKATELGFTHAITFDGDGQHVTEDITLFLNKINEEPETLWIGNRALSYGKGEKQPVRSSFGRKFGNFWYNFFTGIKLHDTQCGLRAYPLERINPVTCRGERYEYEQDLLIRSAWNGNPVKEIDIHLFYLPKECEVSHFKPVRDFLLISKINSIAAMTRIFLPVTTLDVPGATWKDKIKALAKHELKSNTSPNKAAASVAMGVFMGIFPIHGFQVVTLMGLSFILRLNRALAFLGVNVSSPPFLPFLIVAAVAIGRLVLPPDLITLVNNKIAQSIFQGGVEFIVGSAILSIPAGLVTYTVTYPMFKQLSKASFFKKRGMFK
jgi:glycosyltransferase involved in cell wall biosynthesis